MKKTISRNCFVICEGMKSHILYFNLNILEKSMSSREGREKVFEPALDEKSYKYKRLKAKQRDFRTCVKTSECLRLALPRRVDYYDFLLVKKNCCQSRSHMRVIAT